MQRRPRRRRIERRVEELLDPCGIQVLRRAVPCIAQRPDTPRSRARRRCLCSAHGDFSRDCAALRRRAVAREFGVPRPHGRRRNFGEIKIRRSAMPLARLGGDVSIGRDQRKLAIERLVCGEDNAQRRALPRCDRRGQNRKPGRVLATVGRSLRPCVSHRGEKCACDQHQCRQNSKRTGSKQSDPPGASLKAIKREALPQPWQNLAPSEFAAFHLGRSVRFGP